MTGRREQKRFSPAKSLGQNFLIDPSVCEAIVEAATIGPEDLVIEIGPGMGALTRLEAKKAKKVLAIELDRRLMPHLQKLEAQLGNFRAIQADILHIDLLPLIAEGQTEGCRGVKIIGNLPYYITTPILMKLVEADLPADAIIVMTQKEVAERISALPGGRTYGAVSVAIQYRCDVETVLSVSRTCFRPIPHVDSTVLRLNIREEKLTTPRDEAMLFRVVRAAFGKRRKILLNALGGTGFTKEEIGVALEKAGIEKNRRAETLSIEDFTRLADAFTELSDAGTDQVNMGTGLTDPDELGTI